MQKVVDIKFKKGGRFFTFDANGLDLEVGQRVVVETQRGLEIGEVAKEVYEAKNEEDHAKVLRVATNADLEKAERLNAKKDEVWDITEKLIKKLNLDMKLVDVEFTLDNSKSIISFVCEDRVDFRELVKELATALKQRVELRQIGIRDKAKLVGGIGNCGKECCCAKFLNDFDKVSIKMAKVQNLSLNPTKISGVCGRLMCCLAYENETYAEASKLMPKINSKVKTPNGEGTVVYNNLLELKCTVKFESENDVKTEEFNVADIKFDKPINAQKENKNEE